MHGDLYRPLDGERAGGPRGGPVLGNPVPVLVYGGHDCVCFRGSPNRELGPSQIGERNASLSTVAEMPSVGVQDGHARLIDELSWSVDARENGAEVVGGLRLADDLGDARRPRGRVSGVRNFHFIDGEAPPARVNSPAAFKAGKEGS